MNCPQCGKPMTLVRENYTGLYPVQQPDGMSKDVEGTFDEYVCEPCQIGVHPRKDQEAEAK